MVIHLNFKTVTATVIFGNKFSIVTRLPVIILTRTVLCVLIRYRDDPCAKAIFLGFTDISPYPPGRKGEGIVNLVGAVKTLRRSNSLSFPSPYPNQKGLEVCYCLWGVSSRPSPGSDPGPAQVPSRVRGGPVQIRHVLCFTVFRTHPDPEVGAIPARPGPILLPSVPYRIRSGRAEADFLATSDLSIFWGHF